MTEVLKTGKSLECDAFLTEKVRHEPAKKSECSKEHSEKELRDLLQGKSGNTLDKIAEVLNRSTSNTSFVSQSSTILLCSLTSTRNHRSTPFP